MLWSAGRVIDAGRRSEDKTRSCADYGRGIVAADCGGRLWSRSKDMLRIRHSLVANQISLRSVEMSNKGNSP